MTFTTPTFLIFLVIIFGVYWRLRRKGQNIAILAASLVFYGWWDWRFLFLLLSTAGLDYCTARGMMGSANPRVRRGLLALSIGANLATLGFFKYFNFFLTSTEAALRSLGLPMEPVALRIVLPIGISFYTFQALSYTIDVYRGRLAAVRDPIQYFCFITFFPHMVAGPIMCAKNLLHQFGVDRRFDWQEASEGCRLMLWGFFKKMVIADNLARVAAAAYADPGAASGWAIIWGTYAFAFQIYCDFSGYTDIAIGCARLFGIHLMRNFAYPYFAQDIREFWRRWHISLSSWFRDYVYIPLGGSRLSLSRTHLNVMIVFVVSGFWHGANWTFLIWGFLHGLYFLLWPARFMNRAGDDVPGGTGVLPAPGALLRMLVNFHLVLFAWVFFRAASLGDAFLAIRKAALALASLHFVAPPLSMAAFIVLLLAVDWAGRTELGPLMALGRWPRPARRLAYYAAAAGILLFADLHYTPFIYFQF